MLLAVATPSARLLTELISPAMSFAVLMRPAMLRAALATSLAEETASDRPLRSPPPLLLRWARPARAQLATKASRRSDFAIISLPEIP